jgi:polyferredoxin
MEEINQELINIQERNARVEADKAWETSLFRKVLVAAITYVIASVAMYSIGVEDFYFGAIIPTIGFLLSTLTIPSIKKWWIRKYFK